MLKFAREPLDAVWYGTMVWSKKRIVIKGEARGYQRPARAGPWLFLAGPGRTRASVLDPEPGPGLGFRPVQVLNSRVLIILSRSSQVSVAVSL